MAYYTYYAKERPLGPGCYPNPEGNPVRGCSSSYKMEEYLEGVWAYGHITYQHPLSEEDKRHYGFFEIEDIRKRCERYERREKIARAVARRSAASADEVLGTIETAMADAPEVEGMTDREILDAMLEHFA